MKIHISRDGQTFGPNTADDFSRFVEAGNVTPDDHCWIEFSEWTCLRDVAAVFSRMMLRSTPPPPMLHHGALGLSGGPPPYPAASSIAPPLLGIAAFSAFQSTQIQQQMEEADQDFDAIEEDLADLNEDFEADIDCDLDF